jgi:hypothetical protein
MDLLSIFHLGYGVQYPIHVDRWRGDHRSVSLGGLITSEACSVSRSSAAVAFGGSKITFGVELAARLRGQGCRFLVIVLANAVFALCDLCISGKKETMPESWFVSKLAEDHNPSL